MPNKIILATVLPEDVVYTMALAHNHYHHHVYAWEWETGFNSFLYSDY